MNTLQTPDGSIDIADVHTCKFYNNGFCIQYIGICKYRTKEQRCTLKEDMIMNITLKEVEINTEYITFVCPVCGADVHIHQYEGSDEIYWMIKAIVMYQNGEISKMLSGKCRVCGCKE